MLGQKRMIVSWEEEDFPDSWGDSTARWVVYLHNSTPFFLNRLLTLAHRSSLSPVLPPVGTKEPLPAFCQAPGFPPLTPAGQTLQTGFLYGLFWRPVVLAPLQIVWCFRRRHVGQDTVNFVEARAHPKRSDQDRSGRRPCPVRCHSKTAASLELSGSGASRRRLPSGKASPPPGNNLGQSDRQRKLLFSKEHPS